MDINYFHWNLNETSSIKRSFAPLIHVLQQTNNVREFSVPEYTGWNPLKMLKNVRYVYKNRSKTGINHVTGDIHYCILGLIGVKSVLTIHDNYAYITARNVLHRAFRWFFWFYLPIKLADRVLCISPKTKDDVDRLVKNDKTQVFSHHAVNELFTFSQVQHAEKPIILQVGTEEKNKNLSTSLRALEGLNVKFIVVRPMSKTQIDLANQLKLDYENKINLSDEEMIEIYRSASIVLLPSTFEGLGLPILEAQTIGRPIITSDIMPMNWVAGKGAILLKNPLDYIDLSQKIQQLLTDETLYSQVVKDGLENVKRFSIVEVSKNILKIYNNLLEEK